ncbi:MAG: XRE family transcriptional regulator [Rhodobacteraceae bacterium]|jgi:transcriptional regulator with XRE-family HTH domain|uniref:Helix-turn-helix domain-containing protein n=1 Tax=Salipiger profundus TaxID=1229727 RepID=A0A1U7CZY0_9RHOB|nr:MULTISPECIES: XRE family transcriptional regulator [Salipiger]APX21400.1 Helix-turn-helix domain-containing protein [Salipiger profundus]MAB08810.1 XRE family transcriptional regulator [Paracoccaceae bacterium]GGA02641.1 DNA-binding protein [Salipiger profundus]SFC22488.1 Helix-turn-helix domain-containing protein [Salipiger profundus]
MTETVTTRLAQRLAQLRADRGLTLDQLAEASGVSRAALSRLEKAEVSPTAEVLGRLCRAYGMTMSRLMAMVEDGGPAHVPRTGQPVWSDEGFTRRVVSPGGAALAAEVIECRLEPGKRIAYDGPPVPGQEHHLVLISGGLRVTLDDVVHDIGPGDALRYRLTGTSSFETPATEGATYMLVLVSP